jgi:hypothetical protein
MSLSHEILRLPRAEQDEALLKLARKLIAEGRCFGGHSFVNWMRPLNHAMHAAGASRDALNDFNRRCRVAFACAKSECLAIPETRDEFNRRLAEAKAESLTRRQKERTADVNEVGKN